MAVKVIVLGAGVIGVTTAYYLVRGGAEVRVLDRQAVVLALAQDLAAGRRDALSYTVVDRDELGPQRYGVTGEETLQTAAATPRELYAELRARHGFSLTPEHLKVAVNTEFSDWSRPLAAGDAVVFIPPVAGG